MPVSNPALKNSTFPQTKTIGNVMTLKGTIMKIGLLFLLLSGTAIFTWHRYYEAEPIQFLIMTGIAGSLLVAIITIIFPKISPMTAPVYALLEGLAIGGVSAVLEDSYPGIVIQAVTITFAIFASLLFLYATGAIKVTRKFRKIIISATVGIFIVYIIHFLLRYFFQIEIPYLHSNGPIGIAISIFIAAIAASNLILDFDFISRKINQKNPKYLEWYAAFGLMITLVWLYFEILRLLQKIRR